ncbi:PAS domain S-box-containing protein [Sphingomonas sp. OV641]|uniref:GAF domain-containing protein n=1 Tax=Sphingomonas sp. OV641 TaxID=1881068 RepID=UPI0008BE7D5B|nr:GAF domain-containing protein [Sphingomonas sp. OV641]SEJ77499.1 PAS domain S-box-containing protein [Sphingomonas sp. OV641]
MRHEIFFRHVADAIRDETDPAAILATVSDMLRRHLGVARVIYSESEPGPDGPLFDVRRDQADGLPDATGRHLFPPAFDALFARFAAGETVVSDDFAVITGPITAGFRDYMAGIGVNSGLAVPLVKGGQLQGVLTVQHDAPRRWMRDEIALVEALAERTWATLTRARAEEKLRTRERDQQFLLRWTDRVRTAEEPAAIMNMTLAMLGEHLRATRTSCATIEIDPDKADMADAGSYIIVAEWAARTPAGVGRTFPASNIPDVVRRAYLAGEMLVSADLAHDERFSADARQRYAENHIGARIGVPLTRGGVVQAILTIEQDRERHWRRAEVALIGEVADRMWGLLERARTEQALKARERDQAFLVEWSDALRSLTAPEDIMPVTMERLGRHLSATRVTYAEADDIKRVFETCWDWCDGCPSLIGTRVSLDTIGEQAQREWLAGEIVRYDDVTADPRTDAGDLAVYATRQIGAFVSIPLIRDGRVAAILSVQSRAPRHWRDREIALIRDMGDRTWNALERARTQAELAKRERDQAFVIAWSDRLRAETSVEVIVSTTLAALATHLGTARANFAEPVAGSGFTVLHEWRDVTGSTSTVARPAVSDAVETAYLAGEPVVARDVDADPRFDIDARERYRAVDAVTFAAVPMVRGGATRGLLSVQDRQPRDWSDREVQLLREVADRLWTMLERARAEASLLHRERNQAFLVEWSDQLRQLTTADQVMAVTLERLTDYLGATRTTYSVASGADREFVVVANWCVGVNSVVGRRFSVAQVSEAVAAEWDAGRIVRYDDVVGDPRVLPGREAYYDEIEVRAFVTVPLVVEGEMRASLSVQSVQPRRWRDAEIQLIRDVSERLWIALDRAHALAELRQRERDQAFLIGWSDLVRDEGRASAILSMTLERVGRYLNAFRANYTESDEAGSALHVIREWTQQGVPALLGTHFPLSVLGDRLMQSHLSGSPVVVSDVASDDRFDDRSRLLFEKLGIGALISMPLVRGGRVAGALSLQQAEAREWRASEIRLLREIGDRTWATLERARSEERLNESEAQLSAFMENAPVAMHLKDGEGRYIRVNPELARASGLPAEQLIGLTAADVFTPTLAREVSRLEQRARAGETASAELETGLSEGYASVLTISFPVPGVSGTARTGGFTIDLTQRKRAEEALARSREALYQTEKLTALGSLLAGVSHELNNPLSIVVAQAVMMERQAKGTELAERAFKIRKAADRCARIVQTFLAMARAKEPERRPVDLNQVAMAALDLAEYGLKTEGVRVERGFDEALPQIAADADQLHQIIINLLINAQHALADQAGERVVRITTAPGPEPMTVVLDVADNGPGVPEAMRRRIFEPFFTTKTQGEGTGVGLSFSQGLAEAHGGRLSLLSTRSGATFRLTLPVDPQQTLGRVEPEITRLPTGLPRRALVVDDEAEIAESLADFLSLEGFTCEVAIGGRAAQARLAAGDFDLIVSDLRMPDMDGPALYAFVRETRPDLATRMAFSTGDTLGVSAARFIADAQRPVLEKPFVPEAVRRFLNQMELA